MSEFQPFPKIPRLFRDITITEKIDGTNGCIIIAPWFESQTVDAPPPCARWETPDGDWALYAQSRNKFIYPGKRTDNAGFAQWVAENRVHLVEDLGVGRHFGEWWGQGIQRGYGLGHKQFSLFNTSRWDEHEFATDRLDVVPVLYSGPFDTNTIEGWLAELDEHGSYASPGFDRPEGVVVFHHASNHLYKVTLGDDGHKGTA